MNETYAVFKNKKSYLNLEKSIGYIDVDSIQDDLITDGFVFTLKYDGKEERVKVSEKGEMENGNLFKPYLASLEEKFKVDFSYKAA